MSDAGVAPAARPPSVDRVLGWPAVAALVADHGRPVVVDAVRQVLAAQRAQGRVDEAERLAQAVAAAVRERLAPSLRPVLNLTGTVLHTNLGRAPLPTAAIEAIVQVAAGASNLEYDLARGERGERDEHVEAWLCRLTGAEAATVVNNNAAAVMLMLNTVARQREVIVSRGELIEIGGAFRLPELMARAGCRLREVGTTNRTHARDFAEALGPKTAALLKAHTSNYRVEGFTAAVAEAEMAAIAHGHGVPLLVDLGSGSLVDLARFGLPHEPTPRETLAAGADLVSFSGDKLLGGPQAGIVVGRADLVAALRRNPMKRALRCDKLTLAALEAVLRLHADPDRLVERVPTLRLLCRPQAEIAAQAARLAPRVACWLGARGEVSIVEVHSQIGSGSLPVDRLPSVALKLVPAGARPSGRAVERLAADLRALPVPVVGRIAGGALLLDLRCLIDEAPLLAALEDEAPLHGAEGAAAAAPAGGASPAAP